jgi:hypothetical protein
LAVAVVAVAVAAVLPVVVAVAAVLPVVADPKHRLINPQSKEGGDA